MSDTWDPNEGIVEPRIQAVRKYVNDSAYPLMEEFLQTSDLVQATTFAELNAEITQRLEDCTGHGAGANFALAHRLSMGLVRIKELTKIDAQVPEVLGTMSDTVLNRAKYRLYLDEVEAGISLIDGAIKAHGLMIAKCEFDLKKALQQSMTLELPKNLREAALKEGKPLAFTAPSRKVRQIEEFGRKELEGCSFAPMIKITLSKMVQDKVVTEVPDGSPLKNVQKNVHLSISVVQGNVDMTVSIVHDGQTNTLKRFTIPELVVKELRRADKDKRIKLPMDTESPLLVCSSMNLSTLVSNILTGRKNQRGEV